MLAGFLIYKYWEAMLTASLMARKINLPFMDVETLLQNSDYQIAVSKGFRLKLLKES